MIKKEEQTRVTNKSTPHGDIQMGTYHHGYFHPYSPNKKIPAEFDKDYDLEIAKKTGLAYVQGDIPVHGSFKDGNFRPAERKTSRRGYIHYFTTEDGTIYKFDFDGSLYDSRTDKQVGYVTEKGNVRFFEEGKNLVSKLNLILAIAGIILGIFFISANLTGNVVADLSLKTSSLVGGILFLIGLVTGFFWLKMRK